MWQTISEHIGSSLGAPFAIDTTRSVGGGSINSAYVIGNAQQSFFVKINTATRLTMFEAEMEGLREIERHDAIKVPRPLCAGTSGGKAYIVMEYLSIHGSRSGGATSLEQLGIDLACMHRVTQEQFGWRRNNTIGSTPQINTPSFDWAGFYREHRLGYQYQLAAEHGYGHLLRRGELLMSKVDRFFTAYQPKPSLLHGDLWSGNYAIDDEGHPVIFDPAVYYGDREADIAMTELFGGFSQRFYSAYNEAYPLDSGYRIRKNLYNLYHILSHLNLFGGGYLGQAERMAEQLLSEV
ncbi:MAG: fructosamine kinase family protein [Gammaproteobacteria bacterium]|nr:fructosamine kinase family protein [Gammaproteobacteria bacterium]